MKIDFREKTQHEPFMVACCVFIFGLFSAALVRSAPPAAPVSASAAANPSVWSMRSHDQRRTGRSPVRGPLRADRRWRYVAEGGHAINMEPTTTDNGVYFGTWGLTRRLAPDKTRWDKFDGKIYGLALADGHPHWPALHPGVTAYAYRYAGRPTLAQDRPAGAGLHWNFYNGTVEGTAAFDQRRGVLYFGRGDGRLYAVEEKSGRKLWEFQTFDPGKPGDPEGGGEVVAGPLVCGDGKVVIATFAAPPTQKPPGRVRIETNAAYCLTETGQLIWRYPKSGGLPNPFVAPPALSPDGKRVYLATSLIDPSERSELTALDLHTGQPVWTMPLRDLGVQDLAVGVDGVVYLAGMMRRGLGIQAAAFAVADAGDHPQRLWGPAISGSPQPLSQLSGGVALMETAGRVERVVVTTTNIRSLWDRSPSGSLFVLAPGSGRIQASWNPETAAPPASGGLTDVTLDGDGVAFVGARGRTGRPGSPGSSGRMYALHQDGSQFHVLWTQEIDGQLDWASAAIGPNGGVYFGSTSAMSPLQELATHAPAEAVPGSSPTFYGVLDQR